MSDEHLTGHDLRFLTDFEGDLPTGTVTPSAAGRQLRRYGPAVVAFVAVIVVWELAIQIFEIDEFILPAPSSIAGSFVSEFTTIWTAGFVTLREAVLGLLLGGMIAVLFAIAAARWSPVREGFMPFAVAASSIPILALAPITNAWFGVTDIMSKVTIVAIIVFFPIMINTTRGLTEVDPSELELMRSFASRDRDVMRRVRIPNALPYFFSALKVAAALALIGAIVAEYFGGRQDALGPYVTNRAQLFQFADAWAAIAVASILGVGMYLIVLLLERWLMPWHVSLRTADDR